MLAADPGAALEALIAGCAAPLAGRAARAGRGCAVKICGITTRGGRGSWPRRAGADAIGLRLLAAAARARWTRRRRGPSRARCRRSCCAWACSWTPRRTEIAPHRGRGRPRPPAAPRRGAAGGVGAACRAARSRRCAWARASGRRRPCATTGTAAGLLLDTRVDGAARPAAPASTFDWSLARRGARADVLPDAGRRAHRRERGRGASPPCGRTRWTCRAASSPRPARKDPAKVRAFVGRGAERRAMTRRDPTPRALRPLRRPLRARDADGAAARAGGGLRRGRARDPAFRAELAGAAARLRRPAHAAHLRRAPLRAAGLPRLAQARGPVPHRRAQDQQRARPGPARAAHGQAARGGGDGRRPARRGHRHRVRAARPGVRRLHGHRRHGAPGPQRAAHAPAGRGGARRWTRARAR